MIKISVKEVLFSEMIRRKEILQAECIQLTKLKDSIDIKEKRKYNSMVNKISRLEKELKNLHSNYDKQISRLNDEIECLGGNDEVSPNTEIQEDEEMPDTVSYDIYEFNKRKNEGTEISHIIGVNHFNKQQTLSLNRDIKGELYED